MQPIDVRKQIEDGNIALGIELGSTRIKSVLVGMDHAPLASASYHWESLYERGIWTYHLEDVWVGLQECYSTLATEVAEKYGCQLQSISGMGLSAMMHGYLAFDRDGNLLVPFRTWANTITGQAAAELTRLFAFNIPQRWSIAHLYQAVLNREAHIGAIAHLTTLAGYVHWKLTDQKMIGVGEASGMFPIDHVTNDYDLHMVKLFNDRLQENGVLWRLEEILPEVLVAGEMAGRLTEGGAMLLDPTGRLKPGVPLCPPEGDAGTGMVATNSVAERTGNISAGTSVFATLVLEKPLSKVYPEIDILSTPTGKPVAMVHSNNCTADLNAWLEIFHELTIVLGMEIDHSQLFEILFNQALKGDPDAGGLLAYNYVSGEHITHMEDGRPLFVRTPASRFTLANFMRMHLFSALGALRIGMDILLEQEYIAIEQIYGHGGYFKTKAVGQTIMAAAMNVPVAVMETAGEGGAWGIALLAVYMLHKDKDETLEAYLNNKVFVGRECSIIVPGPEDVLGFEAFLTRYRLGLAIEKAAVQFLSM